MEWGEETEGRPAPGTWDCCEEGGGTLREMREEVFGIQVTRERDDSSCTDHISSSGECKKSPFGRYVLLTVRG